MKKIILFLFIIIFISCCDNKIDKVVTGAGGKIYVINNSSVPLIHFSIIIQSAGQLNDPADKSGLSDLTSELLLKGTKTYPKEKFEKELDNIGADLSVGSGIYGIQISGTFLKEHYIKYFNILKSVLTEPLFDENEFKLEVERRNNLITNALNEDDFLLSYYTAKYWYKDHPFAKLSYGTKKSLSGISTNDLNWFFERYYAENTVIAGISGDIGDGTVVSTFRKTIESLKAKNAEIPEAGPLPVNNGKHLYIINKPDRNENKIAIIKNIPGFKFGSPDFLKIILANDALGGPGMSSILFKNIRIEKGYLYHINSFFNLEGKYGGFFHIGGNPQMKYSVPTIELALNLFDEFVEQGIDQKKLDELKEAFINQFPFRFETSNAKLARYINNILIERPKDYDETYIEKIKALTVNGVNSALKNLFEKEKDNYTVFVVAGAEAFRKKLWGKRKLFETVDVIDYREILND